MTMLPPMKVRQVYRGVRMRKISYFQKKAMASSVISYLVFLVYLTRLCRPRQQVCRQFRLGKLNFTAYPASSTCQLTLKPTQMISSRIGTKQNLPTRKLILTFPRAERARHYTIPRFKRDSQQEHSLSRKNTTTRTANPKWSTRVTTS